MTFENVRANYWAGEYRPKVKLGYRAPTISADTIIDENMSVKWNREEVKRRNEIIIEDFTAAKQEERDLYDKFKDDLFKAAKSEYKLNRNQFDVVYERVMECETEHDYMCAEFIDDFEDFVDWFFNVVNMR